MEMAARSSISSFFVVATGSSSVRVKSIVDAVEEELEARGLRALHKEGYADGLWVLMDYGDVVVHVFHAETRRFYDLENLWGDAPKRTYLEGGGE
jgi:ribosome-associated protein